METLASLTGKTYSDWDLVASEETEENIPVEVAYATLSTNEGGGERDNVLLFATLGVMALVSAAGLRKIS